MNFDTVFDYDTGFPGYNLFAYCGNSSVFRIDVSGKDSDKSDEGDVTDEDMRLLGGGGGNPSPLPAGGSGGSTTPTPDAWSGFLDILNDALNGLKMGLGEHNGIQNHHFLSVRHSKNTERYVSVTKKYSLNPNDPWNIEKMEGHLGRHTDEYHNLTDLALNEIDRRANGNSDQFLQGFSIFKQFVLENPWVLYAQSID